MKMRLMLAGAGMAAIAGVAGCGVDMNAVANKLREQNIAQEREIGGLKEKVAARDVTIAHLQEQVDAKTPRVQTLPDERLAQVFTASKVEIRSQTDSWDFGGAGKSEGGEHLTGFRIFVRTLTEDGKIIPATGTLVIEAVELRPAPSEPVRLGSWSFTPEEMKKNWYDSLGLHQFAFSCPWTVAPTAGDVTFKATFTDALTGRMMEAHLQKKVSVPK